MKKLNIIVISLLIFITIYTAISKPVLHKHFIIAPAKFKLASINQIPQSNQSTTLFKLFETNTGNYIEEKQIQNNETSAIKETVSTEVNIIPSSLSSSSRSIKNTPQIANSYAQQEWDKLALSNRINSETMKNADRLRNDQLRKELREKELEQKRQAAKNKQRELANKNGRPITANNNQSDMDIILNSVLGHNNNITKESNSCPVCSGLKDMLNIQSKEEIIAWNVWRSNIQNRIMDTSNVNADVGALYTFTFNVDAAGNISNIEVRSNYKDKASKDAVYSAIQRLSNTPILKFPQNTNRKKVRFTGGFMVATYTQYASPSDYNDFERILRTNP